MPGRNGTGPLGQGAMTGRGLGRCNTSNAARYGLGLGCAAGLGYQAYKRGFRNRAVANDAIINLTKEDLNEEKAVLQERLDYIQKEIDREN